VSAREPVGYFRLVQSNRNFRYLWLGQIVSLLGDWFNLIASAALVATLTQSGVAVGGLFVVRMLAQLVVSPFAGVAADRYNRKHLLILTDIGRAIVLIGFLFVREPDQVWLLYLLTAIQLGLSGFFFPTRTAILPDIVNRGELGAANALSSATWSVMLAFGAALGGLAAGQWGVYPSFVIDAVTFVVSALLISQIVYQHEPAIQESDKSVGAALQQYIDGLRYLAAHRDNLVISLHKGAFALTVSGGFQVIQVAMAERIFVLGEGGGTGLGLMYAAVGVGTGIGPIVARRFTGDWDRALRIAIAVSYGVAAAGLLLVATLTNFGVVLVGTLVRGLGVGIGWVFSTQLLLQLVPDRVRGRVFSTEFAIFTLMNAAAAAGIGWAMDNTQLSIPNLLTLMAGLTLVPGVMWVLWNLLRRDVKVAPVQDGEVPSPTPAEQAQEL
jgi:MFS family permease